MYSIGSVKESIAVRLGIQSSFDVLDNALQHHCDLVNAKSPARYLLKTNDDSSVVNFNDDEVLIIYTVDGRTTECGDSQLFVLDRCTMEQHRLHVASQRTIHYAVLLSKNRTFENKEDDTERPLHIVSLDANPTNAILNNKSSSMRILARPSASLVYSTNVLEAAERGQVVVDTDGALTNCCAWLVETVVMIDDAFDQQLAVTNGTTMDVIEAYLWHYTSFSLLHDYVTTTTSIFWKLEDLVSPNSIAVLQWKQKKAMLQNRMTDALCKATWCSLLSRHSLTLKIQDPAKSQSMDDVNMTLENIFYVLVTLFATYPGNNVISSECFLHYLEQRLVTQISYDLVGKCESLLLLSSMFYIEGPIVHKAPRCTNDAVRALFKVVCHSLNAWAASWNRLVTIFTACFETRISSTPANSIAAVKYASMRSYDLLEMIHTLEKVSYGILTPEVMCLYSTMHTAANAFPMLRSREVKNWEIFHDNFQKTLVLKYTVEETVRYHQNDIEPQTLPDRDGERTAKYQASMISNTSWMSTITSGDSSVAPGNQTRNSEATGAVTSRVLIEEREVLYSRVTVMAKELSECRHLIDSLQDQLSRKTQNLETAQELNISLLAEIKRLHQLLRSVNPTKDVRPYDIILSRNDLIAQLAVKEESQLQELNPEGRNIEDDILDEN